MELLADRDPEEARKLLDPVLEHMMEAVHRYEGTVNQVMGDGIMALFGAPLAHEDHAVRACYAALRMQELVTRYAEEARHAHGVNVQIRVGLNSGEVVVRSIGSDLHMDDTAVGQTTHLAGRMEQLASAGSILLTPSTLELVEGFVAVKALGPVPVKGLADPVEVYEVTGAGPARTRLQAGARRGLTRFVGRDQEVEQLRRAQQLASDGHGQIVAVVGEAGVGKSRLVYEFTHSHRLQGWRVLESASVSYGKATSYLPVIDLLKSYFKIGDRDDLREIREPEYQHAWGSKTSYSQLRLDALSAGSASELLDALLGDDPSLGPLKQLLTKRGNPFFLEETVRTLEETKVLDGPRGRYRLTQSVQTIQVPATVQVMLAARIDRLSPEDKRLLQVASVVGKDVPFALLQAVAELPAENVWRGLDHLQAAEFLYETGLYPDAEYSFTHALTQDVTYGGLLQERRCELHARIVGAIETLHGDRLGEHIEQLAHHAGRGQLQEKAVDYLRQAGLKAAARSALRDARTWFEQALGVLAALPDSHSTMDQAFEIRLELRTVLAQLGEIRLALERLREAEALAERLNDDRRRGRVCAFMTTAHNNLGELDEALITGARALEIAGRLGDLRLRLVTTTYLEQAHFFRGDYDRVIELATENLAALPADWIYESFGNVAPASVYDRCWLVHTLARLGRFTEATAFEADAIRLAQTTQHANTVGMVHYAGGVLYLLKGDWKRARSLIERGLSVFRAGRMFLRTAVASSAWVLAQLGETSEALSRVRECEQLGERLAASGVVGHRGWADQSLGRTCLLLGRLDEARRLGERAIECSPGHVGFAAHAFHLLGDIATHPDRFDAARGEAHYREALALAVPRSMRPLLAHCHLGLGKLYRGTGEREQAREHFTIATAMYREMDMQFWLEQAEAAMKECT